MCISIDFHATFSKPVFIFQIALLYSEFSFNKILFLLSINHPVCQSDRDLPHILSRGKTSNKAASSPHPLWRKSYRGQTVGLMLKLASMDELLTLILKLMNILIHSTIHLSYLKVTDYFTEIMCLGLQMKTTQDHSLSSRQIKFQTLLL